MFLIIFFASIASSNTFAMKMEVEGPIEYFRALPEELIIHTLDYLNQGNPDNPISYLNTTKSLVNFAETCRQHRGLVLQHIEHRMINILLRYNAQDGLINIDTSNAQSLLAANVAFKILSKIKSLIPNFCETQYSQLCDVLDKQKYVEQKAPTFKGRFNRAVLKWAGYSPHDLDKGDRDGTNPLLVGVFSALIRLSCKKNKPSPLVDAIVHNDLATVANMFRDLDPEFIHSDEAKDLLLDALNSQHFEMAIFLMLSGIEIPPHDPCRESLFNNAILNHAIEDEPILRFLLEKELRKNKNPETALCLYALNGNLDEVRGILSTGVNVNSQCYLFNEHHNPVCPLQCAFYSKNPFDFNNNPQVIRALIQAKANVNTKIQFDGTNIYPLHLAIVAYIITSNNEYLDVIQDLINAGADKHAPFESHGDEYDGMNAIDFARSLIEAKGSGGEELLAILE